MLKYSKISKYKIKKILKYFVEDYTSTETSKFVKLSRNTVDKYYKLFREIILQLVIEAVKTNSADSHYIGNFKGEYGPKCYLKIYKLTPRLFIQVMMDEKPQDSKNPFMDEDFVVFARFVLKRFSKFHGFSRQSYIYQLSESTLKYAFTMEELSNFIWKHLTKKHDKNKL